MLGAATGFFCWAMPYSPVIGRIVLIVAPALLAFLATLAAFRWIDGRAATTIPDEGDDHEDWLTRARRPQSAPAVPSAAQTESDQGRPVIIDATEVHDDGQAPDVEPSPQARDMSAETPFDASSIEADGWAFDGDGYGYVDDDDRELLLDAPLPHLSDPGISGLGERPDLSIEEMMERLALHIDGREPAKAGARPLQRADQPRPRMSDEDALRAALADLHRMAAVRRS